MDNNQVQGKQDREKEVAGRLDNYFSPQSVEEKQPEPMPSSEQNETEDVKPQPPVPEGATPEPEEELTLPENASERTREQFEKLKSKLKEANEKLAKPKEAQPQVDNSYDGSSVFDTFHAPQTQVMDQPPINFNQYNGLNPLQAENIKQQFIDQEGNVDIQGLNNALSRANQEANRARQDAQRAREEMARFEETQQAREAHAVHPELDPLNKGKFDPKLFELVRDRLLRNMYEGKRQSLLQVANDIRGYYQGPVNQSANETTLKAKAVEEYKQTQQARNQGPLESGMGSSRNTGNTQGNLRDRTRREGWDSPALTERLNNYMSKK